MNSKNTKNKALNKMTTVSHLLVCGLVLSGTVLPATTAFADSTDSAQPTTEQSKPMAETTQPTTEQSKPTTEQSKPMTESTTPKAEKAPDVSDEIDSKVDENGMTPEQVDTMKNSMSLRAWRGVEANRNYVLVNGFYYLNGDTSYAPVMDVTVNYVDKATGAVVGSQTQSKTSISNGVTSSLTLAGLDTNVYGIPYDSGLNVSSEIYINGTRTYTFRVVTFDIGTFMNMEDGTSKFPTGRAVFSVPVSKHKAPKPDPEEVSFKVRHVDENGKDIVPPFTQTGTEGQEYWVSSEGFLNYTLKAGQPHEYRGEYQKGMSDITFHYVKKGETPVEPPVEPPVKQGTVTVKYVDAETNKEIHEPITLNGNVGTNFSVSVPTVKGYTFNKSKSDKLTGAYTANAQTVTLRFDKDKAPTPDDSKLRHELEQTIKQAKPYLNKEKYQAKYVDALDKAIKAGEKALADNPAPKLRARRATTDTNKVFQDSINAINTALKDVKAHPVKEEPSKPDPVAKGKVEVIFVQEISQYFLKEPLVLEGKVGDKYSIDLNDIPKELDFKGVPQKLNQKWFDETVKPMLKGAFKEGTTTIPVVYGSTNSTPDPEQQEVIIDINWVDQDGDAVKKSVQIKGKKGDKYDLSKYAVEIEGYKLDKSKLPTLTGVLGDENTQVTFHYTTISNPVTPDNNGNTGNTNGSTGNNSTNNGNTNGSTGNNSTNNGNTSGSTGNTSTNTDNNSTNTGWNTGSDGNQSNTIWSGKNPDNASTKADAKNGKALPQTGEKSSLLTTLTGLGVLLTGALGFFYTHRRDRKSTK